MQVTFQNKTGISVQAQIFMAYTLISTCVAAANETCTLIISESIKYDIYLRDAATGRMVARKQGSDAELITLQTEQGRYVIHS